MPMTEVAIRAERLGKQFYIGEVQRGYKTFREVTVDAFFAPFRRLSGLLRGHATCAADLNDTLWALRDVEFEIRHGEVVGVIGSNGAGKSTLLKILSRITEPTRGFVDVCGRVGSLLEVGTGFHQELTGRENIYLNGAILGMRKTEIDRKFDEIVAFAEIERFLDTPVKHYSSGMQTRLGFAVAAHLDPEILLVDEVLAVGDAAFQKKCLGKMHDVAKGGRTVLFVSHNMGSISQLCGRAMWLDRGRLRLSGSPSEVVDRYLSAGTHTASVWTSSGSSKDVAIHRVSVLTSEGRPSSIIDFDSPFRIEIGYGLAVSVRNLVVGYYLFDVQGNMLWESQDVDSGVWSGKVREPGSYVSTCYVPAHVLRPGRYFLTIVCFIPSGEVFAYLDNVLSVEISGVGYPFEMRRLGLTTPLLDWAVKKTGNPDSPELVMGSRIPPGEMGG
jgi:lipopolysaccharide transport system ATP-binding protein